MFRLVVNRGIVRPITVLNPMLTKRFFPCRSGFEDDYYGKMVKKNKRLEIELCEARSILGSMWLRGQIPVEIEPRVRAQLKKHREHRLQDLDDCISQFESKLCKATRQIEEISELGGSPNSETLEKREKLQAQVNEHKRFRLKVISTPEDEMTKFQDHFIKFCDRERANF